MDRVNGESPRAPGQLPPPQADPALVAAEQGRPAPLTPEAADHLAQVINRPRRLDREMMRYAAVGVSPGLDSLQVAADGGVAPVGTFTYFSLRRQWVRLGHGKPDAVALVFAGYKARVEDGRVALGGPRGNVCAYDLRFRPFAGAHSAGKILDTRKRTTLRLGLTLDAAAEKATLWTADPRNPRASGPAAEAVEPPRFWVAFPDRRPAPPADCPAVSRAVTAAVGPGYVGPPLPGLCATGVGIVSVDRTTDGDYLVGVRRPDGGTGYDSLPRTAVLRPFVRAGVGVTPGTQLADFVPRRAYPNLRKLTELYGPELTDWLVEEVLDSLDDLIEGHTCRRAEFCPGQLPPRGPVFEDVRHLVTAEKVVRPQLVRMRPGADPLRWERDGVGYDLSGLRPEWAVKFEAVRR